MSRSAAAAARLHCESWLGFASPKKVTFPLLRSPPLRSPPHAPAELSWWRRSRASASTHSTICAPPLKQAFRSLMMSTMCEKAKATHRVAFPNVHDRPEQQTLLALLLRNVVIFFLYAVWIVGSAVNLFYWVYAAVAFLKTIVSLGSIPVPTSVQVYMAAFTTYTAYHYILYRKTPQVKWKNMVQLFTDLLYKYPYYQHQACVFEEHEEECLNNPKAPMVNADERAIFAYHPHGAFTCAFSVGGMLSHRFKNSNTVFLAAQNLFWFPGVNDVLRWLGIDAVTKPVFTKHLEADRNVALYPGGFEEATYFWRGKHRIFLKHRAGFIKLALQFGYKVRPVYTFGEEETYHTMHHFPEWRVLLSKLKIRSVLFWGCFHVFFMPRQSVNMTTVVGNAIQMPKIENPTNEDVRKYHALYMDALVGLFERNKHKYALDPSQSLEIF